MREKQQIPGCGGTDALALEPVSLAAQTPEALQRVLHELQVQQIELEMQNEELRSSRDLLEAGRVRYFDLYDRAPVAYCQICEKGLIVEANLTSANLLGTTPDMLLEQPLSRFILKDDQEIYGLHRKQQCAPGETRECDLRLVKADGSWFWAHLMETAVLEDDGSLSWRLAISDISARKHAEEALMQSHDRLTRMLDSLDAAIYIADMQTYELLYINAYGRRIWGAKPGQTCWRVLQKGQNGPCSFCTNDQLLDKDGKSTGILVWEFQNTLTEKWFDCRDLAVPWTDKRMVRMEIATDITRRKQTEDRLRIMTTDLEALVAARTKQLRTLSAQLTMTEERERRTLAQDLHDSLGQTLAVLKIKLAALSGAVAQSALEELSLLVDRAELEARNAIHTLSPPILRTLGLAAALEWLAEEMHYTYGLTVLVNCAGQGHVLKEEVQAVLYRAARELLINAAKHAGVQRANLTCLCDQTHLTIMVSDDGRGFDPEARNNSPEKHGFGLTSIRERLCNLGGEMEIDSSPGRGTTVCLSLPLAMAEEGHAA